MNDTAAIPEGVLTRDLQGQFAKWDKGTRVTIHGDGSIVVIRRVWRKGETELMNTMAGVSRDAVTARKPDLQPTQNADE